MKTVTTTIAQELEAAELVASSLTMQVQNLESGPYGDYYAWSGLLLRKQAQFTALCEILQDLRSAKDYEERAERFEEAYEDHIAVMEPGSAFMDSCYEAEEEFRKWENEHGDEVEAYEQRKLIPKEY
jgi:hypothetical protein